MTDLDWQNMSDEALALFDGESAGREFREKEIAYDRRGGYHEFTIAGICVYRLMIAIAQYEALVNLRAPLSLIQCLEARLRKFEPYLTKEVIQLLEINWKEFKRDYQRYGLLGTDKWAKKLGIIPVSNLN